MNRDAGLDTLVRFYISTHRSMTLATSQNGRPWAAAVFYVHDAHFNLYFLSDAKTRHASELEDNAAVAATINEDPEDWRDIRGIQMEGIAHKVANPFEKAKALSLYIRKFPFVKNFLRSELKTMTSMVIAGKAFAVSVYKLEPARLFYLDNQKGFSGREEVMLPGVDTGQGENYNG